ncbi:hypothetical protein Sjap_012690 [Stephania japonica]|uniref:Uncharacterized protein n=1 Tax=Stephania japonica TaxID=461633 RepID=A0AAP0IWK4_9MAGN
MGSLGCSAMHRHEMVSNLFSCSFSGNLADIHSDSNMIKVNAPFFHFQNLCPP